MPAHLFIRTGPNSGEIHALGDEPVIVGRGPDCGVRLSDRHASREHFRVEPRGGDYHLLDMKSKNGTALNGIPVSEKKLSWGDEIRVGSTHLVFFVGREPAEIAASQTQGGHMTHTMRMGGSQYEMIGASAPMRAVFAVIEKAAPLDVTVLVAGESGTGKELVARALHRNSPRSDGPLVAVNCAAMPRNLVESELFGHEKGAFTGASVRRRGRFELAHGGTLFLDEIGDLPAESQAKLLRVIEEKKVTRVGGSEAVEVDVRLVAATNRNLRAMVADGKFREDLLFRIEVLRIDVPPLRDRAGDIPELARFYLERFGREAGRRGVELTPEAIEKLTAYDWPGNVRELKNVIEHAVILAASPKVGAEDILLRGGASVDDSGSFEPLAAIEKRHVERAMTLARGNKTKAAELLGVPRSSLYDMLREHGID
jgi:DNA-binding NtrC family response regulator